MTLSSVPAERGQRSLLPNIPDYDRHANSTKADARSGTGPEDQTVDASPPPGVTAVGSHLLIHVASQLSSLGSPSDADAPPLGARPGGVRTLSGLESAWLAGVIDGEGSVGLYRSSDGRRVHIQVANTHRGFVEAVREVVGCGGVYARKKQGLHKGRKTVYQFQCKGSERGLKLLNQIIPYLIVKRNRAEAIVRELHEKPFGRWAAATAEARARASVRMKESWKDPMIRARRIEGLRRYFAAKRHG